MNIRKGTAIECILLKHNKPESDIKFFHGRKKKIDLKSK